MSKKKDCKVCGEPSGKRNVCKKCKEDQPYQAAAQKTNQGSGGQSFERVKSCGLNNKNGESK